MRLIDADDFKIDVDERGFDFLVSKTDLDNVKKMIDEQKTVDAIKVVRCRECKYHSVMPYGWECDVINSIVSEDFFCAKGERKEKTDER